MYTSCIYFLSTLKIPGSSDRLIIEHHLLHNPELRMAKAVQGWLQTIKFDERYQTDLKMAMTKLEPKRIYWFVLHFELPCIDLFCFLFFLFQGKKLVIFLNHRIMLIFPIHMLPVWYE